MKRWQERGEVLDSDGEEASLDGDLDSDIEITQTGSRKRRKLTVLIPCIGSNLPQSICDTDANRNEWSKHDLTTTSIQGDSQKPRPEGRTFDPHGLGSGGEAPELFSSNKAAQISAVSDDLTLWSSSQLSHSDSDELPDVSEILRPGPEHHAGADREPTSSPLTELTSSLPGSPFITAKPTDLESERRTDTQELHGHDPLLDFEEYVPAHGQRNLRIRKEKQVRPYLYDKTLYQRQCREGGVVPIRVIDHGHSLPTVPTGTQDDFSVDSTQPQLPQSDGEIVPRQDGDASHGQARHSISSVIGSRSHKLPYLKKPDQRRLPADETFDYSSDSSFTGETPSLRPMSPSEITRYSRSPTSSQQIRSGFKVPPGFLKSGLPTPIQSSDGRDENVASGDDVQEPSLRSSRARKIVRRVESSVSSSESDVEESAVHLPHRLHHERKRLKGVLPASWLKIDIRAQQQKSKRLNESTQRNIEVSPYRQPQTKGIAVKVTSARPELSRMSPVAASLNTTNLSDSDQSVRYTDSVADVRRDASASKPDRYTVVDDDDDLMMMEDNSIDRMFPRAYSRNAQRSEQRLKQPRITQTFRRAAPRQHGSVMQHSNTPRWQRSSRGATARPPPRSRKLRTQQPRSALLSIYDAISPVSGDNDLPQFVRVALRQSREQPDRGRQASNYKVVKLATATDTHDALQTLDRWRDRKILPRAEPTRSERNPYDQHHNQTQLEQAGSHIMRTPLTRMVSQKMQTVNPNTPSRPRQSTSDYVLANAPQVDEITRRRPVLELPTRSGSRGRDKHRTYMRGAQLERLQDDFYIQHRTAAFEERIRHLTQGTRPAIVHSQRKDILPKKVHLRDSPTRIVDNKVIAPRLIGLHEESEIREKKEKLPQRPRLRRRKPVARRLDIELREYRQPEDPIPASTIEDQEADEVVNADAEETITLKAIAAKYPVNFDISPLSQETHFQLSTLIGSGDFAASLKVSSGQCSSSNAQIRVQIDGQTKHWGSWSEAVAADLGQVPLAVSKVLAFAASTPQGASDEVHKQTAKDNIDYLLRSVVRYYSKCLHHFDQIDQDHSFESILRLVFDLLDSCDEPQDRTTMPDLYIHVQQYCLIFSNIALQLSISTTDPAGFLDRASCLHERCSKVVFKWLVNHLHDLRALYEDQNRFTSRDIGISSEALSLSSLIIMNYTARPEHSAHQTFWESWRQMLSTKIETMTSTDDLDRTWHALLTVFPGLALSSHGKSEQHISSRHSQGIWSIVRELLIRPLDLYESTVGSDGMTINLYIRTLLRRCHHLVRQWNVWTCEVALNVLYDFFAKRNLNLLRNEESKGSPVFLQQLSTAPDLAAYDDDCSFHVFLKLLACALRGMQNQNCYSDRKVSGIAWRFIPSHDRTYPKDADLPISHLESLRNHFDLLSTLYYALPSGHRLRVEQFRRLVDVNTSHREACRVSFRTWTNITSFQASTTEPLDQFEPLVGWFQDNFRAALMQFRLARRESEQELEKAKQDGLTEFSNDLLESTISQNQRQIAAVLIDALSGLKRVAMSASSIMVLQLLIKQSALWDVFSIFDPSQRHLYSVMKEALHIYEIILSSMSRLHKTFESQQISEDSQDFGDNIALEDFIDADTGRSAEKQSLYALLAEPLGQLLSNAIGSDHAVNDELLQLVIDVWIKLGDAQARSSQHSWVSYVDEYSTHSWSQLRETRQKRLFGPYFVTRIVQHASSDDELLQHILCKWLVSLVDREGMLKYQHELTSALLNTYPDHPLLLNPPFSKSIQGDCFAISFTELSRGRVALISNVLDNMRLDYQIKALKGSGAMNRCKSLYVEMLKQLMEAMKTNYREVQGSVNGASAISDSNSSYVEFVQQVISLMQQYSVDLCPVDRFFTDSTAFPLPVADPTYVVGRLRSYSPRMSDPKTRKQFVVFFHTVSERAAIDDQQSYLVSQLVFAMERDRNSSNAVPILAQFMVVTIFPVYLSAALDIGLGWILCLPILKACRIFVERIIYEIDFTNQSSVSGHEEILLTILHNVEAIARRCLQDIALIRTTSALMLLSEGFKIARACLTTARHLDRVTNRKCTPGRQLTTLRQLGQDFIRITNNPDERFDHDTSSSHFIQPTTQWKDTQDFAEQHLRSAMLEWHEVDGRFYIRRGTSSRELKPQGLLTYEHAQEEICSSIADYDRAYERVFARVNRCRRRNPLYLP